MLMGSLRYVVHRSSISSFILQKRTILLPINFRTGKFSPLDHKTITREMFSFRFYLLLPFQ